MIPIQKQAEQFALKLSTSSPPSNLRLEYEPSHPDISYPGQKKYLMTDHIVKAYLPESKNPVGALRIDHYDHIVNSIAVHPEHQHKGIATAMWNHAKSLGLDPQHDTGQRGYKNTSPDGEGWGKSTKG